MVRLILKKEKPNLVLTHNIKGLGYLVPLAIRSAGRPHVHTVHDVQLVEPSGLLFPTPPSPPLRKGGWSGAFYAWLCKKLFGSPTIIISPSQWLLDFYASYGFFKKSKKMAIPNPIFLKKNRGKFDSEYPLRKTISEAERAWCPDEVGTSEAEIRAPASPLGSRSAFFRGDIPNQICLQLLYVSQLEPSRGILFLVETLKTWDKNFHLTIAGSGSCDKELRETLKSDQHFTLKGYIPNENIAPLYATADALVLPSLCLENAPLAISDSFTHSVPVLASAVGGIPEMIQAEETGFTFEAGQAQDLLDTLNKLWEIKKQSGMSRLRKNAHSWTQDKTISHYLGKLLQAAV